MTVRGVLLDLDGVLYVGERAVPGAADAVRWLREQGIPFRFLTNTTSRPRRAIVDKLRGMGVDADEDDVLTPAVAAVAWMTERGVTRPALFVPEGTAGEFADLHPLDGTREEGAGAVVVGDLGQAWDFATLNRAFRLLVADPDVPLVALGLTRFWRAEDGLRLDAGAFVRALEYAAAREAVVLGKPAEAFYGTACSALDLATEDVVMVGDDVRTDVEGAQRTGLRGILVRTGKFAEADLETDVRPDGVLDSLADLPEWWAER